MFGNCINFFNNIADDFIVGLATSFSDRSLTEQLKRNISYQIEHIQNPLVKMYVENNIENWITTVESCAVPLVKSLQSDSPKSVDIARDIVKDSFGNRIDNIAERIKNQLEKEKGKNNNNVSSIQSDSSSNS